MCTLSKFNKQIFVLLLPSNWIVLYDLYPFFICLFLFYFISWWYKYLKKKYNVCKYLWTVLVQPNNIMIKKKFGLPFNFITHIFFGVIYFDIHIHKPDILPHNLSMQICSYITRTHNNNKKCYKYEFVKWKQTIFF